MKILLAACAAFFLLGCATSTTTHGPNGKPAHSIKCNGGANGWGTCYEKAGELCSTSGYDIVMQNGDVTAFGMANGFANAGSASAMAFGGGMRSRNLLVQCR